MYITESLFIANAIDIAKKAHAGQTRKFSGRPYITHPLSVLKRLKDYGVTDQETLVAAITHDCIEDTDVTKEQIEKLFGKKVADYVVWLSNPKGEDKANHIKHLILNAPIPVVTIKVMDRIDNLQDASDKTQFLAKYKKSSDVIKDALEQRGLVKLLDEYLKYYNRVYSVGPYVL
jgi:(p)ppGpp synthase/HD superfamily hydrolase